jgi:signal transduction histidine kinase
MSTRPHEPVSGRSSAKLVPLSVLAIGLLVTATMVVGFLRSSQAKDDARFERAVEAARDHIDTRLDTYRTALLAARGLLVASDGVSADEFRRFVAQLEIERLYPGIQGLGFSRRIDPAERLIVEKELRDQGFPEFRIWPNDPDVEAHAIVFLEPFDERNAAAHGFNMFSEPVRREAMERARDTGEPAASGPVTLVQEIDANVQTGFLLYLPVYRDHPPPTTVEARREQLRGFVYGAFRIDDLLSGIFPSNRAPWVSFTIFDRDRPMTQVPPSGISRADHVPAYTAEVPLAVAGRTWTLTFESQPSFERRSDERFLPYIGGFGLIATLILFLLSGQQGRHAERLRVYTEKLEALHDEREKLLEATEGARAEAETASRAKDEFLAMLGHELRNPLAPIVTALELIKQRSGTLDRPHDVIARHVTHLERLVDDLLDVSRVTRDKVQLRRRSLDPQQIVARAVEMASPLLERHGHHLSVDVATHARVAGDEVRLAQVLSNLLTNAAKYTEPGGHISVAAHSDGTDVVFSVSDDGIGISPQMLPRVFDLFSQGARGMDRSQGGLGIGLTLVKRLVEAHGGSVEARSEGLGRGSLFVVRLPAMRPDEDLPLPERDVRPSQAPTGTARVLVVDDNVDAADLLVDVLRGARWPRGARSRRHLSSRDRHPRHRPARDGRLRARRAAQGTLRHRALGPHRLRTGVRPTAQPRGRLPSPPRQTHRALRAARGRRRRARHPAPSLERPAFRTLINRSPDGKAQAFQPAPRDARPWKSRAACRSGSCWLSSPQARLTIRPRWTAGRSAITSAQRMTCSYSWTERNSAAP